MAKNTSVGVTVRGILIFIVIALLTAGCVQQESTTSPVKTPTLKKHLRSELVKCNPQNPTPLGGVLENHIEIREGETKTASYIFYTGNEDGELDLSIHRVSKFFKTEYLEIPEGVDVKIEPSEFNAKSNHTYKLNVILKASPDIPEVYYESYDGGKIKTEKLVFLVQAKFNNKTINDWFEVVINPELPETFVIPGKSHLIACSTPTAEHNKSVNLKRGGSAELSFKFYPRKEIPGIVNVIVFRVAGVNNFERLDSGGINVDVEPSCYLPEPKPACMAYNSSTIRVNTTPAVTSGKYVFCILIDYKGGILTASWLTVNIKDNVKHLLNLSALTDNDIVKYAMMDDEFSSKYRNWKFNITEKKLVEKGGEELLYVDMWTYRGEWDTVNHVWFYLNEKGELEELMNYPFIKTVMQVSVSDKEKQELVSFALNNSKVKDILAGRDYEVWDVFKYTNFFTGKEAGCKQIYITINNSIETYVISIDNDSISIENTTCTGSDTQGFCFLGRVIK